MYRNPRFIISIIFDGIMGAFGLSALVHIYNLLFRPEDLTDGQYIMTFMITFPVGYLLGSTICILLHPQDQLPQKPNLIVAALLLVGALASPLLFLILITIFEFTFLTFGVFVGYVLLFSFVLLWLIAFVIRITRGIKRKTV
jgi:hypothetical protein